jgi:tRNA pseudouridine55 synthase
MIPGVARPRIEWRRVDGILLLDKPVGLSSNQALQQVRRLYRAAKAGHTGSLDPLASGMLPLCFGQATKVAGLLLNSNKTYCARLVLGSRTSTGDREGTVVETRPVPPLAVAAVRDVLARFIGEREQVPPMYSALKRGGDALYALARRGIEVERVPRRIRIVRLVLESLEERSLSFEVTCSKGTYVRTLAEELAAALGTCGHLDALRRTEVDAFAARPIHMLAELERLAPHERALDALLLPVDAALGTLPPVRFGADEVAMFRHGASITPAAMIPTGLGLNTVVRVYDATGTFIGLGAVGRTGAAIAPLRLMSTADGD